MLARFVQNFLISVAVSMCVACSAPPPRSSDSEPPATTTTDVAPAEEASTLRRTAPFSLADRAAWRAALAWPDSCEEAFRSSGAVEDGGLAIHTLAPRVSIVEVLCARGSYQPSHVYLRYDEQGSPAASTLLEFSVLVSDDGAALDRSVESEVWGESWFSPDAFEMSVLTRSRQLGDCGIWSRYALAGQQPTLTAAAARLPCPAMPGPPAQFTNGGVPAGWRPVSLPK